MQRKINRWLGRTTTTSVAAGGVLACLCGHAAAQPGYAWNAPFSQHPVGDSDDQPSAKGVTEAAEFQGRLYFSGSSLRPPGQTRSNLISFEFDTGWAVHPEVEYIDGGTKNAKINDIVPFWDGSDTWLIAGGAFNLVPDADGVMQSTRHLAKWNGQEWEPFGVEIADAPVNDDFETLIVRKVESVAVLKRDGLPDVLFVGTDVLVNCLDSEGDPTDFGRVYAYDPLRPGANKWFQFGQTLSGLQPSITAGAVRQRDGSLADTVVVVNAYVGIKETGPVNPYEQGCVAAVDPSIIVPSGSVVYLPWSDQDAGTNWFRMPAPLLGENEYYPPESADLEIVDETIYSTDGITVVSSTVGISEL